ncbi:MAG: hypothetical protein ABW047_06975 [Nitrospiraceae bacterium]
MIRKYVRSGLAVYVFFNNDALGHAIENARTLRTMVGTVPFIRRTGE